MVARAWLDSFTMILRCWWSSESNEPAPLSLWHCDPELCSIEKRFQVNGATWDALAPRGASFTPLCGMFLQSPSASSNVANFTFYEILSELWVCEFWLLRWSTMVARAWPVCVRWFRIGCLLPRVKRAHPHVSMTLLSWDIPLISFNGSLWDVLLRCSKWLLGAWLDSFTMILRCWLVVWVKWAPPLSLWHCDPELCSIAKPFLCVGRPISWAVLHHWKSMGQLWTLLPPRVQLLPHFEVWSYRACQPLQVWWFISFTKFSLWATTRQSLPNALSMGLFGRLFAPGANIVPRSYKSHSTRFPIRPHVWPHSWLCDKNCGRSSAPK